MKLMDDRGNLSEYGKDVTLGMRDTVKELLEKFPTEKERQVFAGCLTKLIQETVFEFNLDHPDKLAGNS